MLTTEDEISTLWKKNISPKIKAIRNDSSTSLYDSEVVLMFLVRGVYQLNRETEKNELIKGLNLVIGNLPTLKSLRSKGAALDDIYSDPSRSGSGEYHIFPIVSSDGRIFNGSLYILQFSYLLSNLAKTIISYKSGDISTLSTVEKSFLDVALPFLQNDVVIPQYEIIEAAGYLCSYPNMKARINAKLNWDPTVKALSYYKAIVDQELFLFAIASDLRYVADRYSTGKFTLNKSKLGEIIGQCYQVFDQRLQKGEGFIFDMGVWDDHPDHAYAGYTGTKYPTKKCPVKNGSWDSSHFTRFPYLLRSYRDAYTRHTDKWEYYNNLLYRLSVQFMTSVLIDTAKLPLLANYMSGTNGWYRVDSPEKYYKPSDLTSSALSGAWYQLVEVNPDVKSFNCAMAKVVRQSSSNDGSSLLGASCLEEDDSKFHSDPLGLGPIDLDLPSNNNSLLGASSSSGQKGTRYELYVIMGDKMGWF